MSPLQKVLNEIILKHDAVLAQKSYFATKEFNDEEALNYAKYVDEKGIVANSLIGSKIADLSLLVRDESLTGYNLLDQLRTIYQKLSDANPMDISHYESLAYYEDVYLDQPERAKAILKAGIGKIEEKIKELKEHFELDKE